MVRVGDGAGSQRKQGSRGISRAAGRISESWDPPRPEWARVLKLSTYIIPLLLKAPQRSTLFPLYS